MPNALEINKWNYIVFTYDGQYGRLYKNGNLIGGPKVQVTPYPFKGFAIGTPNPASTIDGMLDEVAIWDRTLTPAEVRYYYHMDWSICNPAA